MKIVKVLTILVLFLELVITNGSSAQDKMYWTDAGTNKIQRANLDGSGIEDLVTTGLVDASAIALDIEGGKMYWSDWGTDKIQRANLDGTDVEDLVTTGLATPWEIALDISGGKMYWADSAANKIQRANLDGTGVEDLVATGLSDPFGIALDITGGKMYWTDYGTDKIQRANMDGTGIEDLVTTGLSQPMGLALDISGDKMYWTDITTDRIQRANLDGTGVENLITTGLARPMGIALDITAGKMYWAEGEWDKIQRANLDGTDIEDLVASGLSYPTGIALAPGEEVTIAFTYQGHLYDTNYVANGEYDFVFKLYEHPEYNFQVGNNIYVGNLQVDDGLFTIKLDFGSVNVFDGYARWLEIGVRPGEQSDPCEYTILSPRQEITPTPYALQTRGIFVDDTGNVGIGTISPAEVLEVEGAVKLNNTTNINAGTIRWTGVDFEGYDGVKWISLTSGGTGSGAVVQLVNYQTGELATGTTIIPNDNTIPQNTEGDEYMTLAITPTSATNKLKIEVVALLGTSLDRPYMSVALFKDNDTDALASQLAHHYGNGMKCAMNITLTHYMTAGTTNEITFKVRCGAHSPGTTYFNGANTAMHGGVLASSVTITEIASN